MIGAAAVGVHALADSSRNEKDFRADSISRTLGAADEFQCQPVVFILQYVSQERWLSIETVNDNVDVTVIEEITERCAAGGEYVG